jgi:tetratricopeptide (TPR) repeat protein
MSPEGKDDRDGVSNRIDGDVAGVAMQAGTVHGGVNIHQPVPEPPPMMLDAQEAPPVLVGRRTEFDELLAVLNPGADDAGDGVVLFSAGTASVAGMGGIGKTALAQAAAAAVRERGWFGGVLWVDLHGYTPGTAPRTAEQALDLLLRALGTPDRELPPSLEDKQARYRAALASHARDHENPLLIVADNASAVAQVAPLRPGIGGHRLLVTSRERLATLTGARFLALDVLSEQATRELLTRLLHTADPHDPRLADPRPLDKLADGCGGLPLAVHITAALLIEAPELGPGELAARLTQSEGRVTQFDDGHRALAAVLDQSFTSLPAEQQEMFTLLGTAPGQRISTAAAAVLADTTEEQARTLLRSLARAHLLVPDADLWSMHDLVAHHARTLARNVEADPQRAKEQLDALVRLLDHYTATAEAADAHLKALRGQDVPADFSGRAEALAWLDSYREVLVEAVHTAALVGHTPAAIYLPRALADYLDFRRAFTNKISITTIARDTCVRAGDPHGEAGAWNRLGIALQETHRLEEAIESHTHARTLFQQIGDPHGEAKSWNNLGLALGKVGRYDEAIDAHRHDLAHCEKIGDTHGAAGALSNLGMVLRKVGRLDEAVRTHNRACALSQQVGDAQREATASNELGNSLRKNRQPDKAADAYRHARTLFQRSGDPRGEAGAWYNLATALRDCGQRAEAAAALERAVSLYADTGDDRRHAVARDLLTEIRADQRHPPR